MSTALAPAVDTAAVTRAPAVELVGVTKDHPDGVRALDHVDLTVRPGDFLSVMGPSGSGKSTLLQVAAGLDTPTAGQVLLDGEAITGLDETRRTLLRRDRIGFVFQSYNLLPALTVADNITLPLRLAGRAPDLAWAHHLSDRVGLSAKLESRPAHLSGGEQQRAAIVRALIARPAVIFADEPTGALDVGAADGVLTLLRALVDELGQTVVMVSHDPAAAARAHRTLVMAAGRVVDLLEAPSPRALAARLTTLGQG